MARRRLGDTILPQFLDLGGVPLSGGRVDFFVNQTTTPKEVFADLSSATTLGASITLDGAGRLEVYLDGAYRIRVFDAAGALQWELDDVNLLDVQTFAGVPNPSFEVDTDGDGVPDSWALVEFDPGAFSLDSDATHGAQSVKFTSTGAGGGYVQSDPFPVSPLRGAALSWQQVSSVADVRNVVSVFWFKPDGSPSTVRVSDDLYDADTGNPTSWTRLSSPVTPPADATFAAVRAIGCHNSDTTPGTTRFDHFVYAEDLGLGMTGETYIDETLNRSFNTVFQNTTGKPIFIYVGAANNAPQGATLLLLEIDAATPPSAGPKHKPFVDVQQPCCFETWEAQVIGLVPPDWYYRCVTGGSIGGLTKWWELK